MDQSMKGLALYFVFRILCDQREWISKNNEGCFRLSGDHNLCHQEIKLEVETDYSVTADDDVRGRRDVFTASICSVLVKTDCSAC